MVYSEQESGQQRVRKGLLPGPGQGNGDFSSQQKPTWGQTQRKDNVGRKPVCAQHTPGALCDGDSRDCLTFPSTADNYMDAM